MMVTDNNCEYLGLSRLCLMESAGKSLAEEVGKIAVYTFSKPVKVVIFTGSGGNGGDGFVGVGPVHHRPGGIRRLGVGVEHGAGPDGEIQGVLREREALGVVIRFGFQFRFGLRLFRFWSFGLLGLSRLLGGGVAAGHQEHQHSQGKRQCEDTG